MARLCHVHQPVVLLSPAVKRITLVVHISNCSRRKAMLEQTPRREAGTSKTVGPAYQTDRNRLFFALVLLAVALAVLVINDRGFWFSDGDASVADEASPEWVPSSVAQAPPSPAAKVTKHNPVATRSVEPAIAGRPAPVVAISRNVIPPLEVEVVAGDTHSTVRLGSNPEKVETAPDSRYGTGSTAAMRSPATLAAGRVTLAKASAPEPSYPLLGRQMKVQGSVLLQALIGADGTIRDLRVLSGPAILASAARQAAQGWQFKPYLQNGQPVETQAKITVNFTIKVLENGVRDETDTVVALSSRGE
jgi:periplasmic protein TonB